MAAVGLLLIFMFVYLTSCQAQSDPPTNLTAVYVADGSIRVTWGPPDTSLRIDQYYIDFHEARYSRSYTYLPSDVHKYQFNQTKPDTTYSIKVITIRSSQTAGSTQTTVTTPAAIYQSRGSHIRLTLPKPPDGHMSSIMFNANKLFGFIHGYRDGDAVTKNGVVVDVTSINAELTVKSLDITHAGYYYTLLESGEKILGGQLLVVTGVPDVPNDFHASKVGHNSVKVGWTSGFNGGHPQYFGIYFKTVRDDKWRPAAFGIIDYGQGEMMEYILRNLTSTTDYVIRLNVFNKLGSGKSTKLRLRTLDIPQTARPKFILRVIILSLIGIVIEAIVIVILVIRKRRARPAQKQRCEVPTRDQELQDIDNPTGFQCSAVQEQEHIYASADVETIDLQEIPGKTTRNELKITANTSGASPNDDSHSEDVNDYEGLNLPRGQEHVYDLTERKGEAVPDKPLSSTTTEDATPHHDTRSEDVNEYEGLNLPRGKEHVYDLTEKQTLDST